MRIVKTISLRRDETIRMAVIYDRPNDLPSGFVVRFHSVRPDGSMAADAEPAGINLLHLKDARALIPDGMVNIGRTHDDDAKIVEVWV